MGVQGAHRGHVVLAETSVRQGEEGSGWAMQGCESRISLWETGRSPLLGVEGAWRQGWHVQGNRAGCDSWQLLA